MADNPFMRGQSQGGGKVTREMLEDYVVRLNGSNFVRHSGKPYFVARRVNDDGTVNYILDRQG